MTTGIPFFMRYVHLAVPWSSGLKKRAIYEYQESFDVQKQAIMLKWHLINIVLLFERYSFLVIKHNNNV